jgi:mannose/fructose/N-acetylgalactosamine-specific phosphotransferase system component IID
MLLRGLAVQGSWNYHTLIGTGLAFVLVPALRRVYRDDPAALRQALGRHCELFNSHPYLAGVAAGAIARLEAEGSPPETVARFKAALRGSLGTLGDRLVWLMWRPMSVLLGLGLLLAGAPWWAGVLAFLLVFNALHLWLRVWGLHAGLREGLAIGSALRRVPFQPLGDRAAQVGAVLAGFAAVSAGTVDGTRPWEWLAALGAGAAGIALGPRVRPIAALAMLLALAAGIVLSHT